MFRTEERNTHFRSAIGLAELIYVSTVRHIRKSHRNAIIGLAMNMMTTVIMVAAFYLMFSVLGLRGSAIRGDFILYLLSGIFLFLTHTKAVGAIMGSEGPTSAMMKHAPMNTAIAIASAALSALYIQTLSGALILFMVHVTWHPVIIDDAIGTIGMYLLAWFSGVAVGMVFLAIKPWFPGFASIASTVYSRANMVASGKMFVANNMPSAILAFFDWNPLFHCIDQARGFAFINYNPHFSSISYPLIVSITLIMVGLMGEFKARRHASISWSAGR
ncbi:ABC-type polysaccharide/polyol phosphate export permease [Litoreibacter halocynthiae]|uniref:ABC-type polysaccharide/polyol phosphate export permease n=1 Tax=Litoreibacter halocynthiae TaxID=1242689 RepID=A0A4R7LDV7_9RHOB|nr:ABC transporter permease [Litoreibacter halocynthiae]TDT73299.1 ABC-type polysaccharide/polyol phosphate export permease [Litoreibacter halocynthiae]